MLTTLLDTQPSTFDNVFGCYAFWTMHATPSIHVPLHAHTYFGMKKLAMNLLSFDIWSSSVSALPVSYTHLTLPTILLV